MKQIVIIITILFHMVSFAQNVNIDEWDDDIDFYQKTLEEKHIDLYHSISKDNFDSKINELKENLPYLSNFQVIANLMKLTQMIGDGHTSIPLSDEKQKYYPIGLFDFESEIRVLSTLENHKHLIGKKLVNIDQIPIEKILNTISPYIQYVENEQSKRYFAMRYLTSSELLHAIGLTKHKNSAKFEFIGDDGTSETLTIKSITLEEYRVANFNNLKIESSNLSKPDTAKLENLWFKPLENLSTVYIKFEKYPSFEEMDEFGKSVLNYIIRNSIKHLIIDLRDNLGGNFFKGVRLIEYLVDVDSINWKDGVYTLCNRATFSAAMSNTVQFRQMLNAKIVGEPTGANPYGYQDGDDFRLPNSNLRVRYSKRLYRFQEENTKGVRPDVLITPKWEAYNKGIDEVLQWVINDISEIIKTSKQ